MSQIIEIRQRFDVLDWVVEDCLGGYCKHGWVEIERCVVKPGVAVEYRLSHEELGDMGKVTVEKAGDDTSLLYEERLALSTVAKWRASSTTDDGEVVEDGELVVDAGEEERYRHHQRVFRAFHSRLRHHEAIRDVWEGEAKPWEGLPDPLRLWITEKLSGDVKARLLGIPKPVRQEIADLGEKIEYRQILLLWQAGQTASEIGKTLNYVSRTVTNIIFNLRVEYGDRIVPRSSDLSERGLK
jgi:hypothetical protein